MVARHTGISEPGFGMRDPGSARQGQMDFDALLDLSERIGRNPMLVQAATGNTSIKSNGVLWIKASGKWLSDARRGLILVPVDLEDARNCIRHDAPIEPLYETFGPDPLRPSIETAMHACLRQRVVVHVHPVNTIAWAVRADAREQLKEKLAGFDWGWIPYVPSGIPLARAIERCLEQQPRTSVFVLGNHGLVVAAEECDEAEELIDQVERRLRLTPRSTAGPQVADLPAEDEEWRLPEMRELHALGLDPVCRRLLRGGSITPCQATFLGNAADSTASAIPPVFRILPGRGVLVRRSITRTEIEILKGFAAILQRVDADAPIRYLTPAEIANIEQHEAKRYRSGLPAESLSNSGRAETEPDFAGMPR